MIKIVKATVNDARLLADLGKKTFVESHGNSASKENIDFYVSQKFSPTFLSSELENSENIFHIIYVLEKPAGYSKIIANVTNPNIEEKNVTKMERLYVLKDYYDLKLGLKLFQFNEELSKSLNQAGMWLYVWKDNQRAVNFYKKAGLKIVGEADFKISDTHSNPNHWMYLKY